MIRSPSLPLRKFRTIFPVLHSPNMFLGVLFLYSPVYFVSHENNVLV
ncbi:hypothetical protein LEP1GSC172_1417 [Leptospira noguchii]|uniref:Uncharacterized protein n=2 Tax=Leptospira noguchii TaxID=28182 RepID=T0FMH5_9LEPT|nr:hypothetical protein LEP1GSC172_1417 [Leptospira noguchii]EQA70715.1 hypothetical protein LEP1GSC059_0200 [Leptospira noguchii serovar Panama str. CZ214]